MIWPKQLTNIYWIDQDNWPKYISNNCPNICPKFVQRKLIWPKSKLFWSINLEFWSIICQNMSTTYNLLQFWSNFESCFWPKCDQNVDQTVDQPPFSAHRCMHFPVPSSISENALLVPSVYIYKRLKRIQRCTNDFLQGKKRKKQDFKVNKYSNCNAWMQFHEFIS